MDTITETSTATTTVVADPNTVTVAVTNLTSQCNSVSHKLADASFDRLPAEVREKLTKTMHHIICASFMDAILDDVVNKGEKVSFPNRFCVKRIVRKARDHVNPKSKSKGDTVHVPAHYVLKFDIMKKLKDQMKLIEISDVPVVKEVKPKSESKAKEVRGPDQDDSAPKAKKIRKAVAKKGLSPDVVVENI